MTLQIPTPSDDVIDSRDVIEAIEALAALRLPGSVEIDAELDGIPAEEWDQDTLFSILAQLEEMEAEAAPYMADWEYGATLVRDSYFEQYAEELADDLGLLPEGQTWPYCHIDWEAAADSLKMNYTEVRFGGVSYWGR